MKNNIILFLGIIFLLAGLLTFIILNIRDQKANVNFVPTPISSPQKSITNMTFTFAGDAMFGRGVYQYFHDNLSKLFQNFDPNVFQNKDIAILNLEGPIVDYEFTPDTNPENLIMKFPLQTQEALKSLNINTVGLANNHTENLGQKYLDFTRHILNNSKIAAVGDPKNKGQFYQTFTKDNLNITIIAINILANTPDLSQIIKEQKDNHSFVIIFPHWGGEYEIIHNFTQANIAHTWIEEGADLVIGSHPHVVQDAELYHNHLIFYSLGNFIFDQTFSENTQKGLILSGKLTSQKLILNLLPTKSVHLRPELMSGQEKEAAISKFQQYLGDILNNDGQIELKLSSDGEFD